MGYPYLVSDLDEQDKDDENKQVVEDTDCTDDDVDHLQSEDPDVCKVRVIIIIIIMVVVVVVIMLYSRVPGFVRH